MTVYANHFDTDGVVIRLHLQAGMLAVVGLAASTSAAVGPNSAKFVGCCVLLRLLLVSLYARAFPRAPDARASSISSGPDHPGATPSPPSPLEHQEQQ